MNCPGCGAANPDDSRFCNACGGRMAAAVCPACQADLAPGARFCNRCGASVTAPVAPSGRARPADDDGGDDAVEPAAPARRGARRPAAPAPPPEESRAAVWLGVGVAVLGFAWLVLNKDQAPPAAPVSDPHAGHVPALGDAPGVGAPGEGMPGGGGGPALPGTPAMPTGPSGPPVRGTITVHESLKGQVPAGGFFFVMAKPAGSVSPMPLAVARIPASAEPTPFSLGAENVMGAGSFAGPLDISVRWDQDGVAGAQPGDLTGSCARNPVQPGAADADLVLTARQ